MLSFSGTYDFDAPRTDVWAALNSPQVLQATIPGCTRLDRRDEGLFEAHLKLRFGLLRFQTRGVLRVEVVETAKSYRLHGTSDKTLFGSGAGVADVVLQDRLGGGTHLHYQVDARLEGRLANLGATLVSGQLQRLGTRFFTRFEAAMQDQNF